VEEQANEKQERRLMDTLRAGVKTAAGSILLKHGRETKWWCFGATFEISSGHRKLRF